MVKQLHEIAKRDKGSVIDFIEGRFKHSRDELVHQIRQWCLNLAWFRGEQNIDFDPRSRSWLRNDPDNTNMPWRVRIISNLMMPLVRKSAAKLSYIHPVWDVIPATPDEEDIQIANTSTKILQDVWQQQNMNIQLIRLLFWMLNCSSSFLKVSWDAEAGDELQVMSNELEKDLISKAMEKFGLSELPQEFNVPTGQLGIDVVTPFNITIDNNLENFEDNFFCIESHLRSKDWVIEKFGNKFKNLSETSEVDILRFPSIYDPGTRKSERKGVLVHDLYVKKCNLFKKGLYCCIGGGEILIAPKDNPFSHGQLPYTHFLEIFTPGNVWGTCVSDQVRSNQSRYNRISSGIIENINLNSNLQWLNPEQNKKTIFTNEPGAVLKYQYPYEPKPVQPRAMPAYVERMLDRTRMDMQDTASSHDVSEAKAEPGIRSGKAVLALQDADDSIYGPVLMWFDESLSKAGVLAIQTIAQYASEERTVQITGEYNQVESLTFTGAMLKGKNKANYWNVRVKTFGRQAMSRSGRENLARTLIDIGVLNPQMDRDKILHIMGTADLVSMFDQDAAARSCQYEEIQKLMQGQPVQVELLQNHNVHIECIRKFKNGGRYKGLNPQQRQAIDQHVIEHLKMQAQEQLLPQVMQQEILNAMAPAQTTNPAGPGAQSGRGSSTGGGPGTGTGG